MADEIELEDFMARLQLDVTEETKTRFKLQAVREGVTMSELSEKALKFYLDHVEKAATSDRGK